MKLRYAFLLLLVSLQMMWAYVPKGFKSNFVRMKFQSREIIRQRKEVLYPVYQSVRDLSFFKMHRIPRDFVVPIFGWASPKFSA